jgi:Reverse transcriptase (RNA-dependent DNA polymerase)
MDTIEPRQIHVFTLKDFLILLLYVDDMLIAEHNAQMIDTLKKKMSKSFDMKDMSQTRRILDIQIIHDRKTKKLWLSQEKYIERVLERFNMQGAKQVSCSLPSHLKLSKQLCPSTKKENDEMSKVTYSSAAGSLMYAIV